MLVPENQPDKAGFLIQELFQTGFNMGEFIGQMLASSCEAGLGVDDAILDLAQGIKRFGELVNSTDIWPTLLPGGGQAPEWEVVSREHARQLRNMNVPKPTTVVNPATYPNIVLAYKSAVYVGEDVYYTDQAEFFMDEHGLQWVKFVPQNGQARGDQLMIRTDSEGFRFARDRTGRLA